MMTVSFRSILRTASMDSMTIHGLPRIFASRHAFPKVVWTVLFLACCAGLGIFLVARVTEFNRKKVRIEIAKTASKELPLPSLTICDADINHDNNSLPFGDFPASCTQQNGNQSNSLFRQGCQLFMSNVSFSCTFDFHSSCRFPRYFSPVRNWKPCFTFNGNGSAVQSLNEKFNGVDMLLYKDSNGLPDDFGTNPLRQLNQGLRLYVRPAGEAIGISQDGGHFLIPGQRIEVAVKKMVFKRKPAPFPANCSEGSSVKQVIPGRYSRKNCQSSCVLNEIYEKCGSVFPQNSVYMPETHYPNTDKYVNSQQFYQCGYEVYKAMNTSACDCPYPCEQVFYVTEVSRRPWRQSFITARVRKSLSKFFNISANEVNLDLAKKSLIHLSVFHSDFVTEHVTEEELYSLESLLCDFGGLMGLLIGASLISLFEIIWTLAECFFRRFGKKKHMPDKDIPGLK